MSNHLTLHDLSDGKPIYVDIGSVESVSHMESNGEAGSWVTLKSGFALGWMGLERLNREPIAITAFYTIILGHHFLMISPLKAES